MDYLHIEKSSANYSMLSTELKKNPCGLALNGTENVLSLTSLGYKYTLETDILEITWRPSRMNITTINNLLHAFRHSEQNQRTEMVVGYTKCGQADIDETKLEIKKDGVVVIEVRIFKFI